MKKALAMILSLAMLIALAGCGEDAHVQIDSPSNTGDGEQRADAEYVIKVASTGTSKQPPSLACQDFFEYVESETDGRFQFELHDSSTLGSDADILQQVIDGTLQISGVGATTFSMYTDLLEVLSLPFLLNSYEKEYAALQSEEYRAICDAVGEKMGIKILFTSENGIRHFATTSQPIHSMADMAGLKLRVPTSVVLEKTLTALGASPVSINYNELYTSLQNKIIDGEEVNYSTLAGQKHYEVAKYATEVGLYCFSGIIIANLDFWNSLSPEDQQILEAGSDLAMKNTFEKYVVELDETCRAECKENGMEITILTKEQLQEFKDATAGIVDEYAAKDPLIADFVEMARGLE